MIWAIFKNVYDPGLMFLMHLLSCLSMLLGFIVEMLADVLSSWIKTFISVGGYR